MTIRSILGNFGTGLNAENRQSIPYPGRRRLVEECETIWVYVLQRCFGKPALIAAIRKARPFRVPISGGHFDVWLVDEPHRLPGRTERWSSLEDGTARLWLICPNCRRKVAKLHYFELAPGTSAYSDLWCRQCHGLVYQATNCGSNRWYREAARPIKRLLREKDRLLRRQWTARIAARLAQIDTTVHTLRLKVRRKTQRHRQKRSRGSGLGQRRPYRNLALLE